MRKRARSTSVDSDRRAARVGPFGAEHPERSSEARAAGTAQGAQLGVVVRAMSGAWIVDTPAGTLLCRPRGRLRARSSRWRDERDADRADAALRPGDEDELGEEDAAGSGDQSQGPDPRGGDPSPVAARAPRAASEAPAAEPGRRQGGQPAPSPPDPVAASGPVAGGVMAGDRVLCCPLEAEGEGSLEAVLPRTTQLDRPPVANADQVLIVAAWALPPFSAAFVDRLLVQAALQGCRAALVLNKADLLDADARTAAAAALQAYAQAGYPIALASAASGEGLDRVEEMLRGHLSVLAGPSGAGKSRILAALFPAFAPRSAPVSARAGRGRHTTRHVELLPLTGGGWVADTPGFSRFGFDDVDPEALPSLYPEFRAAAVRCRFRTCLHDAEPDCAVRAEVEAGRIDGGRYARYRDLLGELRQAARRRLK